MAIEKFYSACALNCPDLCAFIVHMEDGRITRLEGDPDHPYTLGRCCPKGYGHLLRTYSADRLLHPMMKDEAGEFQKVTWKKALDTIAGRIKEVKEMFGVESVGIYSGSGNDGMAPRYAARFASVLGTRMIPGIVEICFEGAYEGAKFNVGPFPPHELSDWANSRCILVWGTNKFESSVHCKRVIQEAIDNGAKLIVIDPRITPHAKMADIYTSIRPGTDGALALGLANIIISRNLCDHEFVSNYVIGFDEYKYRVEEYTKKRVSEITWVDENTIEDIARNFATHGPSLIMTAPAGMNHYTNGTWAARAVHSLLSICGYLGVSGGGFQYLSSDNSPFNNEAVTLTKRLPSNVVPVVPSGTYIPEYVFSQERSPLEVLIIQAASPVTQWPNTSKTKKAFEKIPFKICIDLELTDTARLCDIVLPATYTFEHHNIVHSELHRIVQYAPKIIEPRGEARHELEIWRGIAKGLGLGKYFDLNELEAIRLMLESEDCADITLEDLMEHPEGIRTCSAGIPFTNREFNTPSGKVELYSTKLDKLGFDPLPFHEEPAESPISTPDVFKEYPLIMITGRLRERLHSQFTTLGVGGTVTSFTHCTSCQNCVKECPEEAIRLTSPTVSSLTRENPAVESHAPLREKLGGLVRDLAVSMSTESVQVPDEITVLLEPIWDLEKCIGCRDCALDHCPYDVITEPICLAEMEQAERMRAFVRLHPTTAEAHGLSDGDSVAVESKRGKIEGLRLELTEGLDPRLIWASDGWWDRDGNMNVLTDDKHTTFGHTPGFNSVLVRIRRS